MTQTIVPIRDQFAFPRRMDIEHFTRWRVNPYMFRPDGPGRRAAMDSVIGLTERLGLHADFQREIPRLIGHGNGQLRGDRFGSAPPAEMTREIYRVLRTYGYITRDATSVVPLTGLQLFVLRGVSHGRRMTEMAAERGASVTRLREVSIRMYREHGCLTQADMVGCAYRNGWLPTHDESRSLLGMSSYVLAPGYMIKNGA